MTTLDAFLLRLGTLDVRLAAAEREGVAAAALTVTESIRAEIGSDTHGTSRLRGVGRRGAKVGVGFQLAGAARPYAVIQARGPLHLLERDTRGHDIPSRFVRRGSSVKVFIPGVGVRTYSRAGDKRIHSPGSTGKHPFEHGVERAAPIAQEILARRFMGAVAEVWK